MKQPVGPTRERVAENVKQLREAHGLSLNELSVLLRALGRPLRENGVSKIELGNRRVDVDDLVALALALDVTPNRLLLPADASDSPKTLCDLAASGDVTVTTATAWRWACGEEAVEHDVGGARDLSRYMRFRNENRPHDPESLKPSEYERYADVLKRVVEAVDAARKRGLSLQDIFGYVSLRDAFRRVEVSTRVRARGVAKKAAKSTRTRKAR
jgi:transcriptional regulator with XRE-family HTH domain